MVAISVQDGRCIYTKLTHMPECLHTVAAKKRIAELDFCNWNDVAKTLQVTEVAITRLQRICRATAWPGPNEHSDTRGRGRGRGRGRNAGR